MKDLKGVCIMCKYDTCCGLFCSQIISGLNCQKKKIFRYWSSKKEDCRTYSGRKMMGVQGVLAKQILFVSTNRYVQFVPIIARTRVQLIAVLVSNWLFLVPTNISQFSTPGMRSPTFNSIHFMVCTPTSKVH
jgi:hypothetical protein